MSTSKHMKRVLTGVRTLRTAQYVSTQMRTWLRDGAVATEEAAARVAAEIVRDVDDHRADGSDRVRPSLIGGCPRAQAFSFLGMPSDRKPTLAAMQLMNAGTWGHYRWQLAGLSAGFLADIEVEARVDEWGVLGQMDGLCADGSVFELKTTNPAKYASIQAGPDPAHVMQVHAYMRAVHASEASLVYEDRFTLDFTEWRIPRDEELLERIALDSTSVTQAFRDEDGRPRALPQVLPECITHSGQYTRCDWARTCKPEGESHGSVRDVR